MSLLAEVMPEYEFEQRVAIPIDASPAMIFRALREVTVAEMPIARTLGALRYLPGRVLGRVPPSAREPFLDQVLHGGSVVLSERPNEELVIAGIGKYHQLVDQQPVNLRDADHFRTFDDPAYQKLAIAVRVERNHLRQWLVLEARTHALSPESKRAFARYWTVIRPTGNFVSWLLLRATRRRARRTMGAGELRTT